MKKIRKLFDAQLNTLRVIRYLKTRHSVSVFRYVPKTDSVSVPFSVLYFGTLGKKLKY